MNLQKSAMPKTNTCNYKILKQFGHLALLGVRVLDLPSHPAKIFQQTDAANANGPRLKISVGRHPNHFGRGHRP